MPKIRNLEWGGQSPKGTYFFRQRDPTKNVVFVLNCMCIWTEPSIDGSHSRTDPRISTRDTKTMNLFNDKLSLSDPAYPLIPSVFDPAVLHT